jgi:uncharacterized membrane protein (DUF106 family)
LITSDNLVERAGAFWAVVVDEFPRLKQTENQVERAGAFWAVVVDEFPRLKDPNDRVGCAGVWKLVDEDGFLSAVDFGEGRVKGSLRGVAYDRVMARTAEKAAALVNESDEMREALERVRSVAEENGGDVRWVDVKDDISSGEWGRLLEKDVLVESDDGFEFADREAVDEVLDGDGDVDGDVEIDELPEVEDEGSSWTQRDKLAGVAAVVMMTGYYFNPIRSAVGGVLDVFMGPLNDVLPFYAVILVISIITGLYSSLLQSNMVDHEKVSAYQERFQALQEREKEAKERGDDAAVERLQEKRMDAMGDQMQMMKENFRPMAWIMLLTIPAFLWMYWMIGARGGTTHLVGLEQTVVMPFTGEVNWQEGGLGPIPAWIAFYFLCSMGFTQVMRKALDLDTPTPS